MSILLIVTESSAKAGEALETVVKDMEATKVNDGCFLVKTKDHPRLLAMQVEAALPEKATFYVFELDRRYDGYGPVDVNKWLKKNLKK
ncbi:MAG TPA: hypothetical protein VLW45_00975 [Pelomicrobium sp.]|nr:hypothetical protein [Pelomicrobium sp.]